MISSEFDEKVGVLHSTEKDSLGTIGLSSGRTWTWVPIEDPARISWSRSHRNRIGGPAGSR